MPLNPIEFAHEVNDQFLKYQLTAFPLTDPELAEQARSLLRGPLGTSPLIKGPFVSLSRSFKMGRNLHDLAAAGIVHPALPGLTEYPQMFAHQDDVLTQVKAGNHCLVSTGTGSGKTEAFLYPILDHCLRLRDEGAPDGVVAVLVYPMNALAMDQLDRLRNMLVGSGVSFGLYIGATPADEGDVANVVRMKSNEGRDEYPRYQKKYASHENIVISPPEERLTEREMSERPPRILLTNVNQLELLLTRGKDLGMFVNAPLKFLVFDEAHTYSGAVGAEVTCLIRRIRAFCGKSADEVTCIGTSATITDPETGEDAGIAFGHRFFGVDPGRIVLVPEQYQEEQFPARRSIPSPPAADTIGLLERILGALEEEDENSLRDCYQQLTGQTLPTEGDLHINLYEALKANEYIYAIFNQLGKPAELREAIQSVAIRLGRDINKTDDQAQGELLCYLSLGAAAEKDDNPLLRPKVHYFVRGLEGAVIHFEPRNGSDAGFYPKLYLSLSKALETDALEPTSCPPVLVCKNCGQHFFAGHFQEFAIENGELSGGQAEGDNVIWEPIDESDDASRVLFTNRFISEIDDEDGSAHEKLENKRYEAFFCRWCGTLHKHGGSCQNPKCKRVGELVPVWVLAQHSRVHTCPSCGQKGRQIGERVAEPIRPLRAVTVSDVHILAQNMVNAVEQERQKLIVFSDNRQDAAFQAGWMQDHARRYRLRHLIYDYVSACPAPCSLSDILESLLKLFREDRDLAKSLAPEVYAGRTEDAFGKALEDLLRYYLRIALVREWTTGFKQRDSLEIWGLARVVYAGVDTESKWIRAKASELEISPEELVDGVSALLDCYRRNRVFFDKLAPIYSRWWKEGDDEVQRGFIPFFDFPPKGIKEQKDANDKDSYVMQFRSDRGQTLAMNFITKWGIAPEKRQQFLADLWQYLASDTGVFAPVTLVSNKGKALQGAGGVRQVDSSKLGIVTQKTRFRCSVCQRVHSRNTPGAVCTAMHCKGRLAEEVPPADDYNVALLDLPFSMLNAQEHSAQVPPKTRDAIEKQFKSKQGRVNCLVATPTLELGVDIGALDMVLMRNTPPKPSNYWQRAGRAGRRHRMAIIYTYCRRSSHDSYFFDDPMRMLQGVIEAPRFNLRNEVMLRKHVHAAVLSQMIRISRNPDDYGVGKDDAQDVQEILREVFPDYIADYLFIEGKNYRNKPYDISRLAAAVGKHSEVLLNAVKSIFALYWPEQDLPAVGNEALRETILQMPERLQEVVDRLYGRLMWVVQVRRNLLEQEDRGLLDEYEKRVRTRCERYIDSLAARTIGTYTLSVLATEGFLPGYGVYEGSVRAFASKSFSGAEGRPDFDLPRPPSIAVREFVPGNLIYANSGRYRTTLFHFPVGEQQTDPDEYVVDVEHERIAEAKRTAESAGQYGGQSVSHLPGVPICDTDISYVSRITDEEQNRFQLPVAILGYLKTGHRGGIRYASDESEMQLRYAQHIRLVNVGPADLARRGTLGYPICLVCGAARSPYASTSELEHFTSIHKERCGRTPEMIGFSADATVDGLLFQGIQDKASAVNLGEALRVGASQVLEMDNEDLQTLVVAQADESYHLFVYDPMPGGSGLLQQILERWTELIERAMATLNECPSQCERSCYDCMRTYRNAYYHGLLDRHSAAELLHTLHSHPVKQDTIPQVQDISAGGTGHPTNDGEADLGQMLLDAGFPEFLHQNEIHIGPPFGSTTPDLFYEDPVNDVRLAVYLDGLSVGIHGNAEQRKVDNMIRMQLEDQDVEVVEIASSDLTDPEAMKLHFKRIARKLRRSDLREKFQ